MGGEYLGGVWKVSGRCLESAWKVLEALGQAKAFKHYGNQDYSDLKFFEKKFLEPNIFLNPNLFWIQKSFDPKCFSSKNILRPKVL